jgi:SAM-dependent methyltransferase
VSAARWDARYAERGWLREPSSTVVDVVGDLPPGRAVDLAAGPGRHAGGRAARGWSVTAVDFSAVGIAQGRAADPAGAVEWVVADAGQWSPAGPVDLVLAAYVQLGAAGLRRAAGWLAPGGRLVVVGHALRNLVDGVHGPRDPAHLQTEQGLRAGASDLVVERLEEVLRPDEGGTVVELLLVARRP